LTAEPFGRDASSAPEDLFAALVLGPSLVSADHSFDLTEVWSKDGRRLVCKSLPARLAVRDDLRVRLVHEGEVLSAAFGCPYVVGLVARKTDGLPALLLEYAEGGDLGSQLRQAGERLERGVVLRLGMQLCAALACLHGRGIIHRDVKPSNLLLCRGDLRLADFGVAAMGIPPRALPHGWVEDAVGTESFAPPEQRAGGFAPVSAAADIYAAGVTLAALLGMGPATGRPAPVWLQPALHREPDARPTALELLKLISSRL
jgi:serine/threonine protein kinase